MVGRAARFPAPIRTAPAARAGPSRLCSRTALPSLLVRSLFFFFSLFCHLPVAKHCWEPHVGDAAALFQAQEAAAAAAQGLRRNTRLPAWLPEQGRSGGRSGWGVRPLPQPCPRRPGVRLGSAQPEPTPGGVWGRGGAPPNLAVKQRGLCKLRPGVSAAPEVQGQAVGNARGTGRGTRGCSGHRGGGRGPRGGPLFPWGSPQLVLGTHVPPSLGRARRC